MHAAIHERARIALVAVAEDVLLVALVPSGEAPLHPGGEARPAPSPDAAGLDDLDHIIPAHTGQCLAEREVPITGDVVFDLQRVDHAAVAKDNLHLLLEEVQLVNARFRLTVGVCVYKPRSEERRV